MKGIQTFEKMNDDEIKAWTNKHLKTWSLGQGMAILFMFLVVGAIAILWIRRADLLLFVWALLLGIALANVMVWYDRSRTSRWFRELGRRGFVTNFLDSASSDRL